jgi:thioredoxin-dependent peroxiredoxin
MKVFAFFVCLCVGLMSQPALAVLKAGDTAPDFIVRAARGGADYTFALGNALRKGPVVVYFYPKSFTKLCTQEAHDFADAMPEFAASGATVIGISADTIDVQRNFSSMECRDKFAAGADPSLSVISAYGAKAPGQPMAGRISYVIAPGGKILSVFASADSDKHIGIALAAVRKWSEEHKGAARGAAYLEDVNSLLKSALTGLGPEGPKAAEKLASVTKAEDGPQADLRLDAALEPLRAQRFALPGSEDLGGFRPARPVAAKSGGAAKEIRRAKRGRARIVLALDGGAWHSGRAVRGFSFR